MEQKLPKRKKHRLENYDYDSCGAYFLTICTAKRQNYFCNFEETMPDTPQQVQLSSYGRILENAIKKIPVLYPALKLDQYVIMPDHVHMMLIICADENGRPMVAPTIPRVVQQMKGYVAKQIGKPIWQKSFFDHVIRNDRDYEEHIKYMEENPVYWNINHKL